MGLHAHIAGLQPLSGVRLELLELLNENAGGREVGMMKGP